MKKLPLLLACLLAASASAQVVQITKKVPATVVEVRYVPAGKECTSTGEKDIAGTVTGGAVGGALGAGAGAIAGSALSKGGGKSGTIVGGLLGAGIGAIAGGGDKKVCTDVPARYDFYVELKDGQELVISQKNGICKGSGFSYTCAEKGSAVHLLYTSDGSVNLRLL